MGFRAVLHQITDQMIRRLIVFAVHIIEIADFEIGFRHIRSIGIFDDQILIILNRFRIILEMFIRFCQPVIG